MSTTVKKILNIVGDVILGLIILLALFGIIYGLTQRQNNGVPEIFGKSAYAVPTDSMNISKSEAKQKGFNTKTLIHKGDIVFGNSKIAFEDIEVGDVIFFWGVLSEDDATPYIIVHRVVDKTTDTGGNLRLVTRGDNPKIPLDDVQSVSKGNYIAKLSGKLSGLGNIVLFLTTNTWINYTKADGTENAFLKGIYDFSLPIGFGILIILPILVYLIIMVVRLIMTISNNRKVQTMEDIAQGIVNEDAKEAIIQEYLRKQAELAKQAQEQDKQEKLEAKEESQQEITEESNIEEEKGE